MLWLKLASVVVGTSLVIAALIVAVERLIPHHVRAEHNDVAGFVYAVLGVLYAVVLGFVVVNEWESMGEADRNTFAEADELAAVYWDSRAMPADVGRDLEATTKQYAHTVIEVEWPMLNDGGYSSRATGLVYKMRDEINALPTDTPRRQTLFNQSLNHVDQLSAARRQRLSESGDRIPLILWVALIAGALMTIGYTFLFGLSKFLSHFLIAAPLAVMVVMAFVVINMLDHPFVGSIAVHPDAYEIFLRGLPAQR
jgi:hypothetical protein